MLRKEKIILISLCVILILCILGFMQSVEAECQNDMPTVTNLFSFYYGPAIANGEGVQIGDEIRAYVDDVAANGGCIGLCVASSPGLYGAMSIYGDDGTTTEKDGAKEDDIIHFVLCRNGIEYDFNQTSVWHSANVGESVEVNLH